MRHPEFDLSDVDDDVLAEADALPPLTPDELVDHLHFAAAQYVVPLWGSLPPHSPDQRPELDIRGRLATLRPEPAAPALLDVEATR